MTFARNWEVPQDGYADNPERRQRDHIVKRKPVEDYLKLQGRFKNMPATEIAALQKSVDAFWDAEKR